MWWAIIGGVVWLAIGLNAYLTFRNLMKARGNFTEDYAMMMQLILLGPLGVVNIPPADEKENSHAP